MPNSRDDRVGVKGVPFENLIPGRSLNRHAERDTRLGWWLASFGYKREPLGVRPNSVSKTFCVTARWLPSSRTSGSSVDGSPPIAIVIDSAVACVDVDVASAALAALSAADATVATTTAEIAAIV